MKYTTKEKCIKPICVWSAVNKEHTMNEEQLAVHDYILKHTIITDVYEETQDTNIAAAVAGHSKTTTTMNRYAHARRDAAKKASLPWMMHTFCDKTA